MMSVGRAFIKGWAELELDGMLSYFSESDISFYNALQFYIYTLNALKSPGKKDAC